MKTPIPNTGKNRSSIRLRTLLLVVTAACTLGAAASTQETNSPTSAAAPATLVSWEQIKARWGSLPLVEIQAVADKGDPTAQHYLGRYHFEGLGGTTNHADGLKWYRKAADQGLANAQNNLGLAYLQGIGVKADVAEASRWFRLAAQQGFPVAQRNLATALLTGTVTQDRKQEAREWLEKAARSGNADAQVQLAHFLANRSHSGVLEPSNALYWYKKAFVQGRTDVCSNIGWVYTDWLKDPETAIDWFQKGAEKGDSYCELSMGWMYSHGRGVEQNLEEGKKWMRRAVDKGNLGAHLELGKLYELRDVFTSGNERPDYAAAAALYRKGAEAGHVDCGLRLAQLYYEHRAEAKPAEAFAWVCKAADQNNKEALLLLADLYAKGQVEPCHLGETAEQVYWKMARMNFVSGFMALARRYHAGEGVPKDLILASYLYMEAASRSDSTDSAPEAFAVFQLLDDEGQPRPQADKATAKFAQELALFLRVMEKKDQPGPLGIARRYLIGDGGLPQSEFEAYVWFSFAAAQGAQGAKEEAAKLRGKLTEAQLNEANWRLSLMVSHQQGMQSDSLGRKPSWLQRFR